MRAAAAAAAGLRRKASELLSGSTRHGGKGEVAVEIEDGDIQRRRFFLETSQLQNDIVVAARTQGVKGAALDSDGEHLAGEPALRMNG